VSVTVVVAVGSVVSGFASRPRSPRSCRRNLSVEAIL